jgi:hypothetical protein
MCAASPESCCDGKPVFVAMKILHGCNRRSDAGRPKVKHKFRKSDGRILGHLGNVGFFNQFEPFSKSP